MFFVHGKSLNLLIPGLLGAFQSTEINSDLIKNRFVIQKLIAKADDVEPDQQDLALDYSSILPVAYFEYLDTDLAKPVDHHVLFADAVHLELKSDHILARPLFYDSDDFVKLSKIISVFNEYFDEEGLELLLSKHGRIFCHSKLLGLANMTPVKDVLGRDVKHFLPTGPNASDWLRIFNETQMLLHEKLSYDERLIAGQELNSFWFWGGGRSAQNHYQNKNLLGGPRWIRGLCKAGYSNLLTIDMIKSSPDNAFYYFDESLEDAASTGNFEEWLIALTQLENDIILPLYTLLLAGDFNSLIIHESDKVAYECKKHHRYRLFKKPLSLESLCVNKS